MTDHRYKVNRETITVEDVEIFADLVNGTDLLQVLTPQALRDPETGDLLKDPNDEKGRPLLGIIMGPKERNAFLYVLARHEEPDLTWDEFKKRPILTNQIEWDFGSDEDPTKQSADEKEDENA